MRDITFYRLTLELNQKLNNGKINLLDKAQDIVDAKSRFNKASADAKHLVILNLTSRSANLLLRLDGHPASKSVGIRTIGTFVSALGSSAGRKQLFRLAEVRPVEYEMSRTITETLFTGGNEFIDPDDMQKLFSGVAEAAGDNTSGCSGSGGEKPGNTVVSGNTNTDGACDTGCSGDSSENSGFEEEFPTMSLENALEKINATIGFGAFKKEIAGIVKFVQAVRNNSGNTSNDTGVNTGKDAAVNIGKDTAGVTSSDTALNGFPYHYVLTGDAAMDHEMPARLMAEVFWHLGLVKKRKLTVLDITEDGNEYSGINFESCIEVAETGTVFI